MGSRTTPELLPNFCAMDYSRIACFNPETQKWDPDPQESCARCYLSGASCRGKFYLCGGMIFSSDGDLEVTVSDVDVFDPTTNTLRPSLPMLEARASACAASQGGKLYVCGGKGNDDQPLASAESFDPVSGVWEKISSMSVAKWCLSATVMQRRLYVYGSRAFERFDPCSGLWEALPLPQSRPRATAMVAFLGSIYSFGKIYSFGAAAYVPWAERYDPPTGEWTPLANPSQQYLEGGPLEGG